MDMKTLQKSYSKDIHLDTDVLPFGRFNRDKLLKAKQLLEVVGKYVNKITDYRRDRTEKTQEQKQEHQADCEKVSELSSEYFQLIPQKNFVYESLRPLDQERQFQRQFQLVTNLLDFEVASRMLLGAMHRKDTLNPVDYVYQSLRCKLELMKEEDPMAQCILRYVYISSPRAQVEAIYKVERGGEEDRLRKSLIDNRRYLWHGTDLGNMLSILNRGLVVTPLDSNLSGDLYGKGIYFSDLFEKSERYCASYSSDSGAHIPCFMLLCEAALGKQRLVLSDPMTDADKKSGYNSTYVPGYHTLDPAYDVRFPSGVMMPLGDKSTDYYYEDPKTGERHRKSRWESEFVVYNENQVCIRYLVQFRK
ncbi:hypothetical protein BaRGS_00012836 [Batillaria attramentaria]|uniref:Poly [ADP-ribose] polymerase n=1 Tax=Batillaria attramentaria TaxID=370345 RepID=A0ABD0L992_9CAEN